MALPRIAGEKKAEIPERTPPAEEDLLFVYWKDQPITAYISYDVIEDMIEQAERNTVAGGFKEDREIIGFLLSTALYKHNGKIFTIINSTETSEKGLESNVVSTGFPKETKEAIFEKLDGREKAGEAYSIVGWYHSHPGHSAYLSGTDQNTNRTMFSKEYQSSIVVDPANCGMTKTSGIAPHIGFFRYDPSHGKSEDDHWSEVNYAIIKGMKRKELDRDVRPGSVKTLPYRTVNVLFYGKKKRIFEGDVKPRVKTQPVLKAEKNENPLLPEFNAIFTDIVSASTSLKRGVPENVWEAHYEKLHKASLEIKHADRDNVIFDYFSFIIKKFFGDFFEQGEALARLKEQRLLMKDDDISFRIEMILGIKDKERYNPDRCLIAMGRIIGQSDKEMLLQEMKNEKSHIHQVLDTANGLIGRSMSRIYKPAIYQRLLHIATMQIVGACVENLTKERKSSGIRIFPSKG